MEKSEQLELKQVLGAMIFGARRPVSVKEMTRCLKEVGELEGGAPFSSARESDILQALEQLKVDLETQQVGFTLTEVAGGFRLESDPSSGRWVRHFLDIGKPNRLSRPALETLAIIAYRQPLTRADIEAVRGVNVDHIIRILLEMQLIRIVGRSQVPGKPFLYGTTHIFLEHFGLKDLDELGGIEPALWKLRESLPKKKSDSNKPDSEKNETADEQMENEEEEDEFDDDEEDELDDEDDDDNEDELDEEDEEDEEKD